MLTVKIESDPNLECPMDIDGAWTLYSFCRRHLHFCAPDDLPCSKRGPAIRFTVVGNELEMKVCDPGLRVKMRVGLAFVLSYYEHSGSLWMLKDGNIPGGVEFQWDGTRIAGLLVWNHDPSDMGAKSYPDRMKDAQSFLDEYNAWANGDGLCYTIEDAEGNMIDSCMGYVSDNKADMINDIRAAIRETPGHEIELTGDCAWVTCVEELSKPEEVAVCQS